MRVTTSVEPPAEADQHADRAHVLGCGEAGQDAKARASSSGRNASEFSNCKVRFGYSKASSGRTSHGCDLGSGGHRYRVIENWAKLPEGWEFKDVAAVAVDSKDRVYCFNRGEHPMIVFDREGNFLKSWGEGSFPRAHGIHIDADDILYLTDDGGHFVRKCTTEGKVLLEPGAGNAARGAASPFTAARTPLSPWARSVSDGYGNANVHKYSPEGSCCPGEPGTDGPVQHRARIVTDEEGWVTADRENHRVQVFDGNGKYEINGSTCTGPAACTAAAQANTQMQFLIGGSAGDAGEPHEPISARASPSSTPRAR